MSGSIPSTKSERPKPGVSGAITVNSSLKSSITLAISADDVGL